MSLRIPPVGMFTVCFKYNINTLFSFLKIIQNSKKFTLKVHQIDRRKALISRLFTKKLGFFILDGSFCLHQEEVLAGR